MKGFSFNRTGASVHETTLWYSSARELASWGFPHQNQWNWGNSRAGLSCDLVHSVKSNNLHRTCVHRNTALCAKDPRALVCSYMQVWGEAEDHRSLVMSWVIWDLPWFGLASLGCTIILGFWWNNPGTWSERSKVGHKDHHVPCDLSTFVIEYIKPMVEVAARQREDSGPSDLAEPSGKEPCMEWRFGEKHQREREWRHILWT